MASKQSVLRRKYTQAFQIEAVRLSESVGVIEAAKRLGIPDSTLSNWIAKSRSGELSKVESHARPGKRGPSELERENERLRRELANAQADLEIVKKAAAYFAKESR